MQKEILKFTDDIDPNKKIIITKTQVISHIVVGQNKRGETETK